MVLWFILIFLVSFFTVYTKYYVVLENKPVWEAIKQSSKLSFINFTETFKYIIKTYILYTRFIINTLIVVWIPLLVFYILLKLQISNYTFVKYLIFIIIWLLMFLIAYIEWIIVGFFLTQWYNIYNKLKKEDEEFMKDSN